MKLGVSSYSFSQLFQKGMPFIDCVEKTKEMGFDGLEIAGLKLAEGEDIKDCAKRVREACEKLELEVVNYTIAADFMNPRSGGSFEEEVERLQREVDIAEILGAPGMRHDATWGFKPGQRGMRGFDEVLPLLAQGCRAVTEYAAEKGIKTMVENHGYFAQDSDRVEKLITAVGNNNFGLLCDMGNFLCADEDPIIAVSRTAPYAVHAHAKDFHVKSGSEPNPGQGFFGSRGGNYLRGAIIGHGVVPVQQCLRILKAAGYDGFVSVEFEGIEEAEKGISIGLANLRRYVEEISKK